MAWGLACKIWIGDIDWMDQILEKGNDYLSQVLRRKMVDKNLWSIVACYSRMEKWYDPCDKITWVSNDATQNII